tara:strand:- start:536 stop:814 length:279 start_codon:yes stop_codon:yes gene_type:complete
MTHDQLVRKIRTRCTPMMKKKEVEEVLDQMVEVMLEALAGGEPVKIRKLGLFKRRVQEARNLTVPGNGTKVAVPRRGVPVFRPAKALKHGIA